MPRPTRRPPLRSRSIRALPLLSALAVLFVGSPLVAQDPGADPVAADTVDTGVTPRGAFLRAIAIPSWGHASIDSRRRGAFYLAAEGGTLWMLVRVRSRLHDARRIRDFREESVRTRLALEGITDEAEIEAALAADDRVDDARDLVDARVQQFEDWTALGIFLVLLSGADALVSAHLKDFPQPVQLTAMPVGGGRVEVGARITLPNR